WTETGPLGTNWARAAGTPACLIGGLHTPAANPVATPAASGLGSVALQAAVSGSLTVAELPDGTVQVALQAPVAGSPAGSLVVVLTGTPLADGGVSLSSGHAQFGPLASPQQYTGPITALSGGAISAALADGTGHRLALTLNVVTDPAQGTFQGHLVVTPQ
ncbi:MAG: hypothetical protein ACYDAQ_20695, partial [Mycobacteriales bacterium]